MNEILKSKMFITYIIIFILFAISGVMMNQLFLTIYAVIAIVIMYFYATAYEDED